MAVQEYDIATLLQSSGVGTIGTDIFVGREPAGDTQVVTVYPTGGLDPSAKFLRDYPSVQVRIRGARNDYAGARAHAQAVKDALLGADPQSINGEWYAGIWMKSDILFIGYDSNDCPIFTTNWRMVVEVSSGTHRLSF